MYVRSFFFTYVSLLWAFKHSVKVFIIGILLGITTIKHIIIIIII